jgi:hypothetical protein
MKRFYFSALKSQAISIEGNELYTAFQQKSNFFLLTNEDFSALVCFLLQDLK